MGLLDYLFDQPNYDAAQTGLLSRLQPSLANAQPSQGFQNNNTFTQRYQPSNQQPLTDMAPGMPIGNYLMPRFGNADSFTPQPQDAASLPPNAQPTQGQMPPQAAPQQPQDPQQLPPALGGANFGGGLGAGLQSFANTPGGLIPKLAGGVSGLLTGQRSDPQGLQQQNLKAQYDSLVPVLGPQKAMLAVMNPEAAKTLLTEALTNKEEYGVISENPIEGKKYGFINKYDQTINGQPIGAASGTGAGQTSAGLLAPGVTSYNPSLSGDEYLKQFSPEVQAATKAYMAGDVLPSGNPRQQGIASQAKTIAQKYGADMGIPVSDALYAEKRKYRTELGSNSANSAGGQAKAFNQGISHLSDLADKLEKLDNSNGMGIPAVAGVVNSARQGFSTEQSAISDEAKSLGQTVAGEVGKLFSGSSGGGVHERELTRERFDTVKSKPQLAAALRATIETMNGGLSALEQNRDRILGPNSGVDFVGNETRQKIAKIQSVIDRLEGKSSAAPSTGVDKSAIEAEMKRRGLLK